LGGHGLVGTALTNQDFSAADDEGRCDETKGWAVGPGGVLWLSLRHITSVNASKEMQKTIGVGLFGAVEEFLNQNAGLVLSLV